MTDTGFTIAQRGFELARELNNTGKQLEFLQELSFRYRRLRDYDKAIAKHTDILDLEKSMDDTAGIARAYKNLGIDHYFLGTYDKALENLQKSYEISVNTNDTKLTANILNNIGLVHYKNHNYVNPSNILRMLLTCITASNTNTEKQERIITWD